MTLADATIVEVSIQPLATMTVPPMLHDRIQQHQQHVTELACALLAGGYSRESTRQTIDIIMDSFSHELTAAMDALMETTHAS